MTIGAGRSMTSRVRRLHELYVVQAQLLQVPTESYAAPPSPAAVLAAMVQHVASQLDAAKLNPPEQLLLANLPNQLQAIDFLAENDLQRTVLLQRLWLRLLSAQPVAADPGQDARRARHRR